MPDILIGQVMRKLFELENFISNTKSDFFNADLIPSKATPESETREKKHQNELTFTCSDGIDRLFTWHLRITPGAWRLHFYPLMKKRKIIIGYIGEKIGI